METISAPLRVAESRIQSTQKFEILLTVNAVILWAEHGDGPFLGPGVFRAFVELRSVGEHCNQVVDNHWSTRFEWRLWPPRVDCWAPKTVATHKGGYLG